MKFPFLSSHHFKEVFNYAERWPLTPLEKQHVYSCTKSGKTTFSAVAEALPVSVPNEHWKSGFQKLYPLQHQECPETSSRPLTKMYRIKLPRLCIKRYQTYCDWPAVLNLLILNSCLDHEILHTPNILQYLGKGYNNREKAHEACYEPQRPCHHCCSSKYRGLHWQEKKQLHLRRST
jgi:hypothetical protein